MDRATDSVFRLVRWKTESPCQIKISILRGKLVASPGGGWLKRPALSYIIAQRKGQQSKNHLHEIVFWETITFLSGSKNILIPKWGWCISKGGPLRQARDGSPGKSRRCRNTFIPSKESLALRTVFCWDGEVFLPMIKHFESIGSSVGQ